MQIDVPASSANPTGSIDVQFRQSASKLATLWICSDMHRALLDSGLSGWPEYYGSCQKTVRKASALARRRSSRDMGRTVSPLRGVWRARRHSKGSHPVVFLAYSDVQIASPRLHRCPCQNTDVQPSSTTMFSEPQPSAARIAIADHAHNDCTGPEGSDPQSLQLSPDYYNCN
jgi:hypothetical protein